MRTIYESEDGKQFDSKEECLAYEASRIAVLDVHQFCAADAEGEPVLPVDGEYNLDNFDYFACFTEEGLEACRQMFDYNGVRLDFELQLNEVYYYDYDQDKWRPLQYEIDDVMARANVLQTIQKKVLLAKPR